MLTLSDRSGQEALRVMSGSSLPGVFRRLALAAPALALALVAGCEVNGTGSYPADLTYPGRTDPIVTEPPGEERFYTDQPGTIEKVIDQIGIDKDLGGPGGKALNPKDLSAAKRQEVTAELRKMFGTPANPTVSIGDDEAGKALVKELNLENSALAAGSQIYRRHCLTCHGLPGDGRGPTGPWVNPHPRDYRKGAFKFISTDEKIDNAARKPRRADLLRTLNGGIDGTTMPSFAILPADHLEQLASYIIHLSLRGEVELETLAALIRGKESPELFNAEGGTDDGTVATHVKFLGKLFLERWAKSNKSVIETAPYPYAADNETQRLESVKRGYQLFTNSTPEEHPKAYKGAGCIACHQDFGRQVNFKYDQWGSLVRPANLTLGVFRGGRRPVDIYWRIRGGIIPSQMPLVKLMETKPDGSEGTEIDGKKYWDLVNFIQALPYPEMLPKDVRDKVYPPAAAAHAETQHAAR
jgi:mono/diheme cytochrome c family protein